MSLFKIEFHDGRTFHNLINIICKITGSCQLHLRRDSMKIESFNGLSTAAIRVEFNMDYIQDYFLDDSIESHFINFKNNSLPSKGNVMKKNDTLILSQDIDTTLINVSIVTDLRSIEGGQSSFHNSKNADEDRLDIPEDEEFTRCKMKLDRLCNILKHSTVSEVHKVFFDFYDKGLKVNMKDSQEETVWSSGEDYDGAFQRVEVEKNIISELTKLNTLRSEGMCIISSYEEGGLLRIKLPVGCYATLEIYLIECIKENEEE